ncbi:MAG: glutathione S-transferase family protein [Geminicoccaceae bacterium]
MSRLTLVLGNRNYSSWSLRPWLLMRMLDIDFEEIVIPLDQADTRKTIARYTPAGRVPVLIDGDLHVWDSLAIMEYLAESHPSAWPADRRDRARARSLAAEMHSGFMGLREEFPMNIRAGGRRVEPGAAAARDIERVRGIFEDCMEKSKGPMLLGNFCALDAMFAPVVMRFRTYALELGPLGAVYADKIVNLKPMREWSEHAHEETWRIEHEEVG